MGESLAGAVASMRLGSSGHGPASPQAHPISSPSSLGTASPSHSLHSPSRGASRHRLLGASISIPRPNLRRTTSSRKDMVVRITPPLLLQAAMATIASEEFHDRATGDDGRDHHSSEGATVLALLRRAPVDLLEVMVREAVRVAELPDGGTLAELQDLLDCPGVEVVDLCGQEVAGPQGKSLRMSRPGQRLRNGRLTLRGGHQRVWFSNGGSEDQWVGLLVTGKNCALEDLEVTGMNEPGNCVFAHGAQGLVIERVHLGGCRADHAVWVTGAKCVMRDCSVIALEGKGCYCSDGGTLRMEGCRIEDNRSMGVMVSGAHSVVELVGGRVCGNGKHGVYVHAGGTASLSGGVEVRDNDGNGVLACFEWSLADLCDASVVNNGEYGAVAEGLAAVRLEGERVDLSGNKLGTHLAVEDGEVDVL
ncbi:unnamed protein product [Pedinophyceae sp. YPF-701]|nr:unnamed protein product [Pedinophyceae sp. YPF-701]